MRNFVQDLRSGLRMMVTRPGFTSCAFMAFFFCSFLWLNASHGIHGDRHGICVDHYCSAWAWCGG